MIDTNKPKRKSPPPFTEEHRQKISEAVTGEKNGRYNKPFKQAPDFGAKISALLRGKKRVQKTCPICGFVGSEPGMTRFHFGNCKGSKQNNK